MATANPEICAQYITSAGLNCITHLTNGVVPQEAMISHTATMQSFAGGLAPTICDFVNNFINNVTGMWTATIEAAQKIINAIKKALSKPKKIPKAIREMLALARQLIEKIKGIIEFLGRIVNPNSWQEFALAEYNGAIQDFEDRVNRLEANARAACLAKRTETLNRLNAKLAAETNQTRIAKLQESIARIESEQCTGLVTIEQIDFGQWTVPNLVFGIKQIIESFLSGLKVPALVVRQPFTEEPVLARPTSGITAKLERAKALTDSKIDMLQKTIEPYITAFNTMMEFFNKLKSLSLKGVLKWLIKLPKKIIQTWLNHAKFAINLVKSIVQQNLSVLETWIKERYAQQIATLRSRAQMLNKPGIESADQVTDELNGLLNQFKSGGSNIRYYIESRVQAIGSQFGFIMELLMKIYGGLMGSMSYVIQIVTSSIAPLLTLIGFSKAMFGAEAPNNPADPNSRQESAQEGTDDFDIVMFQPDGDGNLIQLGYDEAYDVFIPIDASGIALSYETISGVVNSGVYPAPPDERAFVPHGYFSLTADADGEFTRVNEEDTPNQILPLNDPAVLAKIEEPNRLEWHRFARSKPPDVYNVRVLDPTTQQYIVIGTRRYLARESFEFIGTPTFGYPVIPEGTDPLSNDEMLINGSGIADYTTDLSAPGPTEPVKLFDGRFFFRRWFDVSESPWTNGTMVNDTYLVPHRPSISGIYQLQMEEITGYYNYSQTDDGIQYRVSGFTRNNQVTHNGASYALNYIVMEGTGPIRPPADIFKYLTLYVHPTQSMSGNFDPLGKFTVSGSARIFTLYDRFSPLDLQPDPRWYLDGANPPQYDAPYDYKYNNANGGAIFSQEGLPTKSISSNGAVVSYQPFGYLGNTLNGVTMHYKKEGYKQYSGILAYEHNPNEWYWSATLESGITEYYVTLSFANGLVGYFYDKDDPKELTS